MHACINDPKKKYKGDEPSPKGYGYCAHSEKLGKIQKGKDDKIWQVKIVGSKQKWVKLKCYKILDNYNYPFLVVIEKNNIIKIYKFKDEKYAKNLTNKISIDNYDELVKEYKVIDYIIGKSSGKVTMSNHKPNSSKYFDGNTILLKLNDKKFVYIGDSIYEFNIENDDKFIKYYSLVGNNAVPYPVLVGKNNIYFMLDKTYIPLNKFPNNINLEESYYYYYGHNRIYDKKKKTYIGKSLEKEFSKSMNDVKIIQNRYL